MNALTTTQSSTPKTRTSVALSEPLTQLLDSVGSLEDIAAEVGRFPALIEEARSSLPALYDVATAKAGAEGVRQVVSRRFGTFPQPQRSEAEWAAFWADYFEQCSDKPLASLEAAMRAWVGRGETEYLPKPGKLKELAASTPSRSLTRYQRAARAVANADVPPEHRSQPGADAEKVRAMLAEFKTKTVLAEPVRKPLPYIGGTAGEDGLSPRMRELLNRQAGAVR